MSNLEAAPAEVECARGPDGPVTQVLRPRPVPLGGPRAMTVRRTLPQRSRSLIGAWCFVDHYGPDDVSATGGMQVAGHPHTCLQTASWLFSGEIEHHDTTGAHALVRPGELNLMTAGSGIAHSEYTTAATTMLHGVQLWIALPEAGRFTAPRFDHYVPPAHEHDGALLRVFLGGVGGQRSPVPTHSPLVGAEITLDAATSVSLALDAAFEHGVLVDSGEIEVDGTAAAPGDLVYRGPGADHMVLAAGPGGARALLLGGEPLAEQIVMWWNFVGRSHEEIARFRAEWQDERAGAARGPGRFGTFPRSWTHTLPAPALPNARLRPRG